MIGLIALLAMALSVNEATAQPKREVVFQFATCVVRRAPDRARALLGTEPGGNEERALTSIIARAYNACVGTRRVLSFSPTLLRGEMADILFRQDATLLDRAAHLSPGHILLPDIAAIDKKAAKVPDFSRETRTGDLFREEYARCIASSKPSIIAELVPTEQGSQAERAVIASAGDHLMRCMPEGISYHLKPAELRPYIVAASYYAVVHAPVGA